MRVSAYIIALTMVAGAANAQSKIDTLCGYDNVNEVASVDDVVANPDGFYIRSLQTQLSHGDPRIILAAGGTFHLCTRSAATPNMDRILALQFMNQRRVRYLFVPSDCPKNSLGS